MRTPEGLLTASTSTASKLGIHTWTANSLAQLQVTQERQSATKYRKSPHSSSHDLSPTTYCMRQALPFGALRAFSSYGRDARRETNAAFLCAARSDQGSSDKRKMAKEDVA